MSSMNKLKIAIIGATGYTGLDLVYLLSKHSKIKILNLCATKNLGKSINSFDKRITKKLPKISSINSISWNDLDLVFLSLPNGEAQKIINKTFNKYKKLKYIDLSADFRIKDLKEYYLNYQLKHKSPKLIKYAKYSISEFNIKNLDKYRIIANPGCYPTSILIPMVPLITNNYIKNNEITIDSKSGFSGAGKNLEKKFKHQNLYSSTYAYNIKNHRHICEIDQEFKIKTKRKVNFTFNPHLLPTFRGILSSIYFNTKKNITANLLRNYLLKYYKKSKFIKILKLNSQIGSGNVLNTNNLEISVCQTRFKNRIVIFSAIDNLVKGASGQAIQIMNILYGYPEDLGLK